MIDSYRVKRYCCEDPSLIENYQLAIDDTEHVWDCHHRLEIVDDIVTSSKQLKDMELYYNRPASDLIFLTKTEHNKLHMTGEKNPFSFSQFVRCNR